MTKTYKITNNSMYPVTLHRGTGKSIYFEAGETITTTDESLVKSCKGFAYTKQFIIEEVK